MENVIQLNQQESTLTKVRELIERGEITVARLAKETGISSATVSQVLNGKYKADPSTTIDKMTAWLSLSEQRRATPVVDPGFVITQTAKEILNDMTYAHVTSSIVVIFGASGVGKSETLLHYSRSNNNVWRISAAPSRATLTECLYELAGEMGLDMAPRRKGPLSRVIRQRLAGTEGLIVIDEADHLDYPTLEELRILQEDTQVGMVLVGNNKIYSQLTGGSRNEDFARLFSRIAKKRGIHNTKARDVELLADAWQVHGKDERAYMRRISKLPGGLRLLTKTLKLAVMFSAGVALKLDVLKAAFSELDNRMEAQPL